ncbi:phosphonate ABC transporter ATP-binding protein [Halostagnicola larsenii XH-48]|uniref:Phosphonate ABC transporter ATP-binding protein n=1 Tax=Halostagnicola larsenii XH-48 TaxID=797299 RepID=W0JSE2_9EURY|nr:phosphonate ABC transporter ATP-binding protein [Halostagnicola larsenii]AHG00207.1 phosphonate ABC transporter ATP-binding protein [Halostagnicola larsenii XH-48]
MSTIEVQNLSKRFGDTQALEDVSFTIPDGEFVVVLGTSGSGKSTLLRCMNGLTAPSSGEVIIDGTEIHEPHPDTAMVFQQHNIIGQMSAYANALTGSLKRTALLKSLFKRNDKADKYRALEALETVGLLEEAQQSARRMSGGQQQRVGIARALVQEPETLLADEPVASLDPGSAQQVMEYLLTATEEHGLTTAVSLHQVTLAEEFGQRFIGLKQGQVVFDGYADEFDLDVIEEIYEDVNIDQLTGLGRQQEEDNDSDSGTTGVVGV